VQNCHTFLKRLPTLRPTISKSKPSFFANKQIFSRGSPCSTRRSQAWVSSQQSVGHHCILRQCNCITAGRHLTPGSYGHQGTDPR